MKTASKKMELVESYGQNKKFIKIMAKNSHFPCFLVRLAECVAHGPNVLKNQKYFFPGSIIPILGCANPPLVFSLIPASI